MKNKHFIIIIFVMIISFVFIISNNENQNENVQISFEEKVDIEYIDLYFLNDNEEYCIEQYKKDSTIEEILDLYTQKINFFYDSHSPLLLPTTYDYSLNKDVLTINIDKCYQKVNIEKVLTCFSNTFHQLNVNTIDLFIGKAHFVKKYI